MLNDARSLQLSATALWQRISEFELFRWFTDQEQRSFLRAYQQEVGMGVRRFSRGETISRKGEYELELCVVLSGKVELFD